MKLHQSEFFKSLLKFVNYMLHTTVAGQVKCQ